VRITGLRALSRRGFLSVALRSDEGCRATVSARMSSSRFKPVSIRLVAGERTVVRLRAANRHAVIRALRRGPRTVAVRVHAVDASGNARTLTDSVRARRSR
jgi:hypothetical protein